MEINEVIHQIDLANQYLKKCYWMDFEITMLNAGRVVASGSVDMSSGQYAIDIVFERPYFISCLFAWGTNTTQPFIELTDKRSFEAAIKDIKISDENYIFKILAENYDTTSIYIVACGIKTNILIQNPF